MLKKIRTFVLPFYKKNDKAHQIDHADEVYETALKINKQFHLHQNMDDIALAVYLHDIFSNKNQRKLHHKLASDFVLQSKDDILKNISAERRRLIANAILEHRASFEGKYSSKLSELLAAADRGKPNLKKDLERSTKYHKGNTAEAIKHMKEKFGRYGYAKYPEVYKKFYEKELEKRYRDIDALSILKNNLKSNKG